MAMGGNGRKESSQGGLRILARTASSPEEGGQEAGHPPSEMKVTSTSLKKKGPPNISGMHVRGSKI